MNVLRLVVGFIVNEKLKKKTGNIGMLWMHGQFFPYINTSQAYCIYHTVKESSSALISQFEEIDFGVSNYLIC